MDIIAVLKSVLDDPTIKLAEQVQSLWSGYGQIIRCTSVQNNSSYIVKVVAPANATKHPRGWNTSTSHQRKLTSYQIEASFYQHFAAKTDQHCKVPKLIASKTLNEYTLLVMEDLDESGYFMRLEQANWQTLTIAIRWLAYFHVRFLSTPAEQLWPIGSYWHLETRQDEFNAMPDSLYKQNANRLHQTLNNAQFKTLIHGDAKFANLCFHHNGKDVAAVDFQYVGCGSGVKDLAYLAGSCFEDEQLFQYGAQIVEEYLSQIKQALSYYHIQIDVDAFEQETRALYPVAWADFYRFLLGWNPQSRKIGSYMEFIAKQGLEKL